jgi:hypothetical protein
MKEMIYCTDFIFNSDSNYPLSKEKEKEKEFQLSKFAGYIRF